MPKAWFFLLLLFFGFLLSGCLQTQYKYVCSDGRILDLPQACLADASAGVSSGPGGAVGSALPQPTLPPFFAPSITPPSSGELGFLELAVLDRVNAARVENGLGALEWSERSASAARKYAQELVESGRFAHTGQNGSNVHERLDAEGLVYFIANENLAQVSFNGTVPEAKAVVDGWMQSPGHRSNIIDVDKLYSHAGVGVYCGTEVCVFVYSAVSLRRSASYSLERNFYSFVYVNDPGYGFGRTVPVRLVLSDVSGQLDAFVLPNSSVFEEAKSLPPSDFKARRFSYLKAFEGTPGFTEYVNASVGTGVMFVNAGEGSARFSLTVELTG
ncbi:CAP domain-containing protein [Candidatus Micrarchaeota archaeon]|nr:CAP domain-containing protein [Candidatus Micrarchaeota archaeon]